VVVVVDLRVGVRFVDLDEFAVDDAVVDVCP
jgi:hypothetical protein